MGKYENALRKAVSKFVKSRVEVYTLYQYKSRSSWKNANTKAKWNKKAKYRMVTQWRRRNVNIKHANLYVTFQQGKKLVFYKNSRYTTRQKDFSLGMVDKGNRRWHKLITLHFKVRKNYGNGKDVWGGWIGSTPQASIRIPFSARKKDSRVRK